MRTPGLNKLVSRAQKGEKDAFGKIYKLHLKEIFRFIYFSLRNYELSQDLTQNTFFKAWRALPNFSLSRGSFRTFLFAIARNLIIDEIRRKREISLEAVAEMPSNEDSQEETEKNELKRVVQNALSSLSKNEQHLIVLHFFEEFKFREVAKILGKREGAVRVATHRILKKMKRYLEEKNYE